MHGSEMTPNPGTEAPTDVKSYPRVAELEAEIALLRDVERATRVYFREFDHLIGNEDYPERSDLRDALAAATTTRATR
jgi:hypothetical protein